MGLRPLDRRDALALAGFAGVVLLAFRRMLLPGALLHGDNPVHQAELAALLDDLLPNQHWFSGWSFAEFGGYPLYLYHYVLGPYAVALSTAFGALALSTTYKLWVLASFALAGYGVFKLLQSRGLVAFLLASLFLFVGKLPRYHADGMWSFSLGLALLAALWISLERLTEERSARRIAVAGGAAALLLLCHPYVVFAGALLGVAVLLAARRGLVAAGGAAALAVGLAAFYVVPFLSSFGWGRAPDLPYGIATDVSGLTRDFTLGFFDVLPQIASGPGSFEANLVAHAWYPAASRAATLLLIPALVFAAIRRRTLSLRARTAAILLAEIVVFQLAWWTLLFPGAARGTLLQNLLMAQRLLPVAWMAGFVLIGEMPYRRATAAVAGAGLAASLLWFTVRPQPEQVTASQTGAAYRAVESAFDHLASARRPDSGRLAVRTTFLNLTEAMRRDDPWMDLAHVWAAIPCRTGWPVLGAWCSGWLYPTANLASSEEGRWWGSTAAEITPQRFREVARAFNVERVLLPEDAFRDRLVKEKLLGPPEWTGAGMAIHPLADPPPGWLPGGRCTLRSGSVDAEVTTSIPSAALDVSVSFHPFWRATLDGRPIPLRATELGLTRFDVESPGTHRLEMEFAPPRVLPLVVTLLSLLALVSLARRR